MVYIHEVVRTTQQRLSHKSDATRGAALRGVSPIAWGDLLGIVGEVPRVPSYKLTNGNQETSRSKLEAQLALVPSVLLHKRAHDEPAYGAAQVGLVDSKESAHLGQGARVRRRLPQHLHDASLNRPEAPRHSPKPSG